MIHTKAKRKPTSRAKKRPPRKPALAQDTRHKKIPFGSHIQELRRRVYYVAISIVLFGCFTYAIERKLIDWLIAPAGDQKFIYTSPAGGLDFLFRVVVYGGLVFSLPVIIYNVLRFIQPLISSTSNRFIVLGTLASAVLGIIGMVFGYFIGLPTALHLLFNQFVNVQVQPLVTIQSYLSFVIVYMVGSALLFQLPLIVILINRIRPLKPRSLMRYQRWVILISFIMASLMNPSPNLLSQVMIAGPIILSYQLAILIVMYLNRDQSAAKPKRLPGTVQKLYEQDQAAQEQRNQRLPTLKPINDSPAINLSAPTPSRNVLDSPGTDTL